MFCHFERSKDIKIKSKWYLIVMLNLFQHLLKEIPKQVRNDSKVIVMLNLFQYLFEKDSETSSE